jgi:hypothetical protein
MSFLLFYFIFELRCSVRVRSARIASTGCGGVALTSSTAELVRVFVWFEFVSLGPRTLTPVSEMALLVKSAFVDWTWYGVDRISGRCALLSKTYAAYKVRSGILWYIVLWTNRGEDGNAQSAIVSETSLHQVQRRR